MMKYGVLLGCLMLTALPVYGQDATQTKTQADYDREVEESLKALTEDLQNTSVEMVKYLNAFNKALSESVPQLSQNMTQVLAAIRPIAETMQKNVDDFAKEIDKQMEISEENNQAETDAKTQPLVVETQEIIVSAPEDISAKIDAEMAQFETPREPVKIKLFPSTVE